MNSVRYMKNPLSKEYILSIRKVHFFGPIELVVFTLSFILLYSIMRGSIITGLVAWCIVMIPITVLSILSLRSGDNKIPSRIGLSVEGIYFEGSAIRKSKHKGFIPWEKVVKIIQINQGYPGGKKHPNEYLVLYRGRDKYPLQLYGFLGYNEIVIGMDVVAEIEKFCKEHNIPITIEWRWKS